MKCAPPKLMKTIFRDKEVNVLLHVFLRALTSEEMAHKMRGILLRLSSLDRARERQEDLIFSS